MNRKNNPWLSLVALLLAALILVLTCTGCAKAEVSEPTTPAETEAETEAETPDRFTVTNEHHGGVTVRVITDTATGKEYIVVTSGYAGIAALEG